MKQISLLMLLVATLASAQREDYPGQRDHLEPPKGWYCTHDKRAPKTHQCTCYRMCGKDKAGNPTLAEDVTCKTYCHPKSCSCPTSCETT
jgi:hypothetical protein